MSYYVNRDLTTTTIVKKLPSTVGGAVVYNGIFRVFLNGDLLEPKQYVSMIHEFVHILLGHPLQDWKSDAEKELEVREYLRKICPMQ